MVYTNSMMKKKKVVHEEAAQTFENGSDKSSAAPVVTQVVEVVEEKSDTESPTHENAGNVQVNRDDSKQFAEGTTLEEVDNLDEIDQTKPESQESNPDMKASTEEAEAKSKEVVQELFSKRDPESITEISIHRKKRGHAIYIWAIIVIVASLTTGFGLLLANKKVSIGSISVAIPTPTPTPPAGGAPTPTPAPIVSREEISIQVLNGGGVPGAASKMKNFLVEKGYKVADVGNSDDYTYKTTEILVKADKADILKLLSEDLKDSYTVGTTAATLSSDASYDARVIVGKE
jgi:hypothetical protein